MELLNECFQKMATLRQEQEETAAKYEELQAKVKTLEQENLAKEQEIKSLSHNNQRLEGEVEKLEGGIKEHKSIADQSSEHSNQNEALQRRLQLLEEEAEEADKNMRETNEKYVSVAMASLPCLVTVEANIFSTADSVKQMSKPVTTSERSKLWKQPVISGRRSTRRCQRSTSRSSKSCTTSSRKWATCKAVGRYEMVLPELCGLPAVLLCLLVVEARP